MDELPNQEASSQCVSCGTPFRAEALFCSACGHALIISTAPPAEPARDRTNIARQWGELKSVGWLFGLLLLSSFSLGIMSKIDSSPWPDVIISIIAAAIVLGFVLVYRPSVVRLLAFPRVSAQTALDLVLASLGIAVALAVYFVGLHWLGVPMIDSVGAYKEAGWPIWSMFLLVSLGPAVVEEFAFRGVIQSVLVQVTNEFEAWLIQAALFSVLHLSPVIFLSHFVMGLWFGWLRRRTKSLYPGMAMHALWNAMVLIGDL